MPTSKYRENIGRACKNGDGRELGDCGDYENIGALWARPRIADIRTRRARALCDGPGRWFISESIPLPRLVTDSWQRSLATGVDPDRGPGEAAAATQLTELRNSHPLARALPVIRRLLVDHAADSGALVGVTAADGALLWVEGDSGQAARRPR